MINLKKTYVDINGIMLDKVTYYLVTFTKEYEFSLFGKIIKNFKRIEEVPFVFESFDIAKEFCELKPKYKKYALIEEGGYFKSIYHTYKLILNNKLNVYLIWKHTTLKYNYERAIYTSDEPYPIVLGFIKDEINNIILPSSRSDIPSKKSPKAPHLADKLSDIFAISETEKHHFELVEK